MCNGVHRKQGIISTSREDSRNRKKSWNSKGYWDEDGKQRGNGGRVLVREVGEGKWRWCAGRCARVRV